MPEDKKTIVKMAYIYSQEGRWDKAIAEYKKLLKLDPNDFNVHNMLGDVHVKKGEAQSAFAAYVVCADAYVKLGQTEKASVVYRKIAKLDTSQLNPTQQKRQAIYNKQVEAEDAMEANDFDKATAAFNDVIKLDPDRFDIYQKLGDLYVRKGDNASAVKNYFEIGNIFFTNKLYKKASPIFKKIAELDPGHVEAQAALGEIYAKEGNESDAKKSFLAIAQATLDKKDLDNALKYSQKAADLKSIEAYYYLGQVYFYMGKPDKAQSELEKLLRFKLNHSGALTFMGRIFAQKKEYDEAISTLNRALKSKKDDPEPLSALGEVYEAKGDANEAGEQFALAAKALQEAGNADEAKKLAERALKNDPENADALALKSGGAAPAAAPQAAPPPAPEPAAPPAPEPPAAAPQAAPPPAPEPAAPPPAPPAQSPGAQLPPLPEPPKSTPAPPAAAPAPAPAAPAPAPAPEVSPEEERKTLLNLADGYVAEGNLHEAIEIYQRILNNSPDDKDVKDALHNAYAMLASASGISQDDGSDDEAGGMAAELARMAAEAKARSEEIEKQEAEQKSAPKPSGGKADSKEDDKKKAEQDAALKKEKEELERLRREAEEQQKAIQQEKEALEKIRKEQEEARKRAEEEIRKQFEDEARKRIEAEKAAELEVMRKKAEEDARKRAEEEVRLKMEEEMKAKEMRKKQEDELRKKIEAEVRAKAEAETKAQLEAAQKKAEEESKKQLEAEMQKRMEAEKKFEKDMAKKREEAAKERMSKAAERAREILEQESKIRPTMKPAGSLASLAKGVEKKVVPAPPPKKEVKKAAEKDDEDMGEDVDEFMTATVADIYTRQGLYDEAIRIYQKILAKDPKNKDLEKKLNAAIEARDGKGGGGSSAASSPKPSPTAPSGGGDKGGDKGKKGGGKPKKSRVSYL